MNDNLPLHKRPVVYTVPDMDKVVRQRDLAYRPASGNDLLLDAYLPANLHKDDSLPGVLFIHGGPVSPKRNMKETGQYLSWGALAAASGFIGFTFNHRYYAPELLEQSVQDVVAAVEYVRERAGAFHLDSDRLCLWTCSGGGPHISFALRDQPAYVRCLVIYYAVLDVRPLESLSGVAGEKFSHRYSPIAYLQDEPFRFPIFIARAGLDHPGLNQTIDNFIAQALQANTDIEVMNHAQGRHGFDIVDDDERTRQIIGRTLAFIGENV